jgi:hypothetical protein
MYIAGSVIRANPQLNGIEPFMVTGGNAYGELKMDNVVAGRLSVSFLSFSIPRRGNGVIRAAGTKTFLRTR